MTDLKGALRQYAARESGLDAGKLSDDTELFSSGLLDSLTVMDFVGFVEECSGSTIPPTAVMLENFDTINRVAALVDRLTREGKNKDGAAEADGASPGAEEPALR